MENTPMAGLAAAMARGLSTDTATPLVGAAVPALHLAEDLNQATSEQQASEAADATRLRLTPTSDTYDMASRTETTDNFYYDQASSRVVLRRTITARAVSIVWLDGVFDTAMRYNILPILGEFYEFDGGDEVFGSVLTNVTNVNADVSNSDVYNKWAAITSESSKGRVSNGDKLEALLRRLATAMARVESSRSRLRQLRSPSPTPHPDTNEMTFGSANEISKAEVELELYEADATKLIGRLERVITTLNARGAAVTVSDWQVTLPPAVAAISALNPAFDDITSPTEADDDEDEEDEE